MRGSDQHWRTWGERDPYFAVITDEKYRSSRIAETKEAFFESGRANITRSIARLERHFGPIRKERALDFGCGVGRVTVPLAEHFSSVIGLDISPAMLAEAERNSNGLCIEYALSDDHLSAASGTFDLVFTRIVLQHIPVKRGFMILNELLDRVGPDGGCVIHMSIKRHGSWSRQLGYLLVHSAPGWAALMNLLHGRRVDTPAMQMNEYPLPAVIRLFQSKGFHELLMTYERHSNVDTVEITSRRID